MGRRTRSARGASGLALLTAFTLWAAIPDPGAARPSSATSSLAAEETTPTASTVRVDLSHSLGAFPFRPGRQLSATPNSWKYGTTTNEKLGDLGLARARVWLEFDQAYDVGTGTPEYSKWYDYLSEYASRSSDGLVVNWRSDYDPLVTNGTFTRSALFAAERDMLADYKRHFPSIKYLEAENEPPDIAAYYPKYEFMYQVVNAVNAMGLPGSKIEIGGPTTDIFSVGRIGQFLDLYAADTDTNKRLDFITYHQYLINTSGSGTWDAPKQNPAVVSTERAQVDSLLTARNLASRPVMVTETGVFPGARESDLGLSADYHIQAAALPSLDYYYLGQSSVTPFDWTIHHPDNDRKSMFADTDTGAARPYYNAIRMESMLPGTRYQATSDGLSSKGIGVYGLAAADPGEVAVMTWNYQWTLKTAYDSRIVLSNFPAAFLNSNVLVTRYRIADDSDTGELNPVEQFVIGPRGSGGYTSQTLPLNPNELRLLVLTPTTKPVGWHS
ncbi:hypothetical protein [Actinoallomurus iriomotensis]|uniref:Glycosyl hydrolase family 39 n=1 Tax=Actinoallomurus iriomotensis TaxID=478107 RepID=A0A9W6VY58_9ACTN|nr:hypothetical protein [Actinoallomurus iriomotensis]GLY83317.1 hypothetical protein Airi02_012470 [Actinoallomurus iriomotensis]